MRLGSYEVERLVGRGGAGVVFRARSADGRVVAIKLLHRKDKETLGRFERERRLLAELGEEAGFVPLIDAGSAPDGPFLVMKFIEGGTLRDRMERGPLSSSDTTELGRVLANALGAAHDAGIVHRDVKPENVLFGPGPLIADLGLAKHFGESAESLSVSLSAQGLLRGTAGYMAPEQMADSKHVGPEADVFALGAVLYECLAGEPPFLGATLVELLARVTEGKHVPLRSHRPDAPAWLVQVVERCLSVDPSLRFADGHALARALEPSSRREREEPARWRSRFVVLAAGVALAASGAFVLASRSRGGSVDPGVAPVPTAALPASRPSASDDEDEVRRLVERGKKDPRSARPALEVLVQRRPDLASAWRELCELELRQHDQGAVLASAEAVVRLERASARSLLLRARAHLERHSYRNVLDDTRLVLLSDPSNADALSFRGQANLGLRRSDLAVVDADAALARAPGDPGALAVRSKVLLDHQKMEEALAAAEKAVASAPDEVRSWIARGSVRAVAFDSAGARSDLERARALDPRSAPARLACVLVDRFGGSADAVAQDAREALALDPWDPRIWDAVASRKPPGERKKIEQDRFAFALSHPELEEFLDDLVQLQNGEPFETQRAFLDAIVSKAPRNAVAHAYKGKLLASHGDLPDALREDEQAIRIHPFQSEFATYHAEHLLNSGDVAGALQEIERGLGLGPSEGLRGTLEALRAVASSRAK
jgi:tetratricopeptide (TPR) repeat protein/predicted Ser/Thr protein kinase